MKSSSELLLWPNHVLCQGGGRGGLPSNCSHCETKNLKGVVTVLSY